MRQAVLPGEVDLALLGAPQSGEGLNLCSSSTGQFVRGSAVLITLEPDHKNTFWSVLNQQKDKL
jgi:hypothetical protein